MRKVLVMLALLPAVTPAQTAARSSIRVSGDASVSVRPDQGKIGIGVETQAATAQEATADNATKAQAVFDQVKALLGNAGDIKTVSFYVNPVIAPFVQGQPQRIVGYTAINTIQVTTSDMGIV